MDNEQERGTVVATKGRFFIVRMENGERLQCEVRKKVKLASDGSPVVVGDDVLVTRSGEGQGIIEAVMERRTAFFRPMVGVKDQKQVLVANIDRLAVVCSVKSPPLKTGLIDRLLIAAQVGNMEPIIVINKIDLGLPENFSEIVEAYQAVTDGVFPVSAVTGEGMEKLKEYLASHRTLFAGHSGVGKSTILNILIPGINLKTSEVSSATNRGKHTTSTIELFELPSGGYAIDSPGLKVMGLWQVEKEELPYFYPEFREYEAHCRFQPCTHLHEPDCAVKKAVEEGKIPAFRYDNYLAIADSLTTNG